ncbi:MAG: hypothetical protein QNJ13_17725 [Paracoccaceae bacterium]|nr:hypothetical protein [Paracoccaceae bacterium]
MNLWVQIALAVASVGVLVGLIAAVRGAAERHDWPAELQRKLIHIGTGLYALALPWLFAEDWPIYLLLGLALVVMTALRLANGGLGGALHGVARTSYGDYLLAISIGLVLLLSERDLLLYTLPLAILTLSDAAAALAGSAYGRRFYTVEDGQKSFEGSAVFFLVTLVIALSVLILARPQTGPETLILAVLVAVFGTQFEADSWRGFDNLFLPLGLLIILATHRDSTVATLLALALVYLGALMLMPAMSRFLNITEHVARVYLVAFFLILSVTAWSNAVLPACVLAAHLATRRLAPSEDPFPELDVVAALALISFGWLAAGNAVGVNALAFYGMSCAGLAAGLAALGPRAAGLISGVLLVGIYWLFVPMSGAATGTTFLALSALTVVVTTGAALLWPGRFARLRVLKMASLAVSVPVAAFVIHSGGVT